MCKYSYLAASDRVSFCNVVVKVKACSDFLKLKYLSKIKLSDAMASSSDIMKITDDFIVKLIDFSKPFLKYLHLYKNTSKNRSSFENEIDQVYNNDF